MTSKPDPSLIGEIAAAEALREALVELAGRLNEGKHGHATDELVQHCREMAEILSSAVGQLGQGVEEDATRAAAAHMLANLLELERGLKRSGLH